MPRFPEEVKQHLKDAGRWMEFTKFRKGLSNDGRTSIEASNEALDFIYGDQPHPTIAYPGGDKFKGVIAIMPDGMDPCPKKDSKPAGAKPKPKPKTGLQPPAPKKPIARIADFEGKKACSEFENVRWVAANMEVGDVSPEDAPSSTAWGMLVYYQSNSMYKGEFWKTVYPKLLPTRASIGDEADADEVDGQDALNILDEIADWKTGDE